MGTHGTGLYDDDFAADLKAAAGLVLRVPRPADALVATLEAMLAPLDDEVERDLFWLVLADQFERRGLASERVRRRAMDVLDSGRDLARWQHAGAEPRAAAQRARELQALTSRLHAPRPERARRTPSRPPAMVLAPGEVYRFATMAGRAWHPYRLDEDGPFVPDGWGALVVLDAGRAFDWIPWLAMAGLAVAMDSPPGLAQALEAPLVFHPQTQGAGRFIPRPAHAKGLGLERLGTVELDGQRVAPWLSRWPIERAVQFDWTIAYAAQTRRLLDAGVPAGPPLNSLVLAAPQTT